MSDSDDQQTIEMIRSAFMKYIGDTEYPDEYDLDDYGGYTRDEIWEICRLRLRLQDVMNDTKKKRDKTNGSLYWS